MFFQDIEGDEDELAEADVEEAISTIKKKGKDYFNSWMRHFSSVLSMYNRVILD